MHRCAVLILSAFLLAWPAHANGHLQREQVEAAAQTWSELYAARDLNALMALYHEDAMLFAAGQPGRFGREAIRDFFEAGFARTKGGEIGFKIEKIEVFGDVANLISLYKMAVDVGQDDPLIFTGRSLLVYKRDAFGHWLIYSDMDNKAPDATPDAYEAMKE